MKINLNLRRAMYLYLLPALYRFALTTLVTLASCCAATAAEPLKYRLLDPELKAVVVDSSPTESFLSLRTDSLGRLFAGGRDGLFVYEPLAAGGYGPRTELYRFPAESWVYDIEIRGNDLYVLTLAALYRIRDGVTQRENLVAERLVWGPPDWHVHQAFHGLAWGPEGDLYLSMGDLLVWYGDFERADHWGHWTMFSQPAGTRTPYTGVGGFFRCRPDGSRLRVVAGGTRNSCGLAFDRDWHLFSNDNDHEGLPTEYVPGRLLHVTPQADFGWPRGWMASMSPDRADLLETMFSGMGRAVPVGQAYYGDTFLPKRYRHNLLVARWGQRAITRYEIEPRGASFAAREAVVLEGYDTTRPVGVTVGRGGRIFAALSYMAHNEGSPVYPSELIMITRADDADSHPFTALDLVTADVTVLYDELESESASRAMRAHQELLRRGGDALLPAVERMEAASAIDRGRTSHLWLAAAAGRAGSPELRERVVRRLIALAQSKEAVEAEQSVRALAEYFADMPAVATALQQALERSEPRLQLAALAGLFTTKTFHPASVMAGPAQSDDTYLRQTATMLLARRAPLEVLQTALRSDEARERLAATLASGFRLTLPEAEAALPDELPLQPWQDDEPYIVQYDGEKIDLRTLGRLGIFTVAEHWRAAEPTTEQQQLFAALDQALADDDERVRLQAAHFLSLLNDEQVEPRVRAVRQRSERERLVRAPLAAVPEAWIAGPFPDGEAGFASIHPPQQGAVDLAAKYATAAGEVRWQKMRAERMFDFYRQFGDTARSSVYAYFRLLSPRQQQVMLLPGSDDGLQVWHNGQLAFTNDVERGGLPLQDVVLLNLQPGSNDILLRVRNTANEHNLYLHYRSLAGSVAWTLPEQIDEAGLAERLKLAATQAEAQVPAELLEIDWAVAAREGDAERGRKLFSAEGLGCAKCHAVRADDAVQGGPSLAGAGSRFTTAYLVESMLLPSQQISPVFQASAVTTNDGLVHVGLVINETAESLEILTVDARRVSLPQDTIEARAAHRLSAMPAGLVRKPDELRDLLAFLLTQTSTPPAEAGAVQPTPGQ